MQSLLLRQLRMRGVVLPEGSWGLAWGLGSFWASCRGLFWGSVTRVDLWIAQDGAF